MLRVITATKAQLFLDRLTAEAANAGAPLQIPYSVQAIISSLEAGDVILYDDGAGTGVEPHRVAIWLHREPDEPTAVYLPHFWCPSIRVLELFGKVTDLLLARGLVTAKFSTEMPIGQRAAQVTGATLGADGWWAVPLAQARQKLTALGVP